MLIDFAKRNCVRWFFFNYFKNRQRQIMTNISQLEKTLLAFMDEGKIAGNKSA